MGDSVANSSEGKSREVCLKCGKTIHHVSYKYGGETFHARCLNCSTCDKRLVGKPFVIEGKRIFCGDQCKFNFEEVPAEALNTSQISENSGAASQEDALSTASLSESLIEALESIQESKPTTGLKFTRQGSPFRNARDPNRLTDYPVRSSSPDSGHLKSHSIGSRRSSLSTVSESSLTSEGSISFDMNKKPRKNILKRSHDPQRRTKNRVRWNLPNGEVNDSDTTSQESFDSSIAGSGIHYRARNAVFESRKNWREFERSPSPGSTGLTPGKHLRPLQDRVRSPTPTQLRNQYNTRSPSPSQESPSRALQSSPPNRVPTIVVSKPPMKESVGGQRRSPSPLDSSPVGSPKRSPSTRHRQHRVMHSTPMRRCKSDANTMTALTSYYYSRSDGSTNQQSDSHIQGKGNESANFNISPLKLDHSNLSDLESSTLEERRKKHLFEFPQQHGRQRTRKSSAPPAYSGIITRPSATSFDDDRDDYDHLSPLLEEKGKDRAATSDLSTVYCENDIDEALKKLDDDESSTSDWELQPQSPSKAEPPPLPPRRTDPSVQGTALPLHQNGPQSQDTQSSTAPLLISQTEANPVDLQANVTEQKSKQRLFPPQKPPPVPPKRYRIGRENRDKNGNPLQYPTVPAPLKGKFKPLPPLPEISPTQEQNADRQPPTEQHRTQQSSPPPSTNIFTSENISQNGTSNDVEDVFEDILPPPPEFAELASNQSTNNELGSDGELSQLDALGSVSNSTLVGDQDDLSPTASQQNTKPNSSSLGELEELSSNPQQHQNSRSDAKANEAAVHPDLVGRSHMPSSSWYPEHSKKYTDHITAGANPQDNMKKTLHTGPDSPVEGYSVKLVQLQTQSRIPPTLPNLRPKHSGQNPSQMGTAQERVQPQAKVVQKDVTTKSQMNAPIPRHKSSLEAAITEENLLGNASYPSAPPRPRHRQSSHEMNSTTSPNLQVGHGARLRRTTSTPHHSKPLPPSQTIKQFSPEDQHLLQTFYSGQKLPTMKPVIHDTERSIEQMLAELESDGSGDEKRPRGICGVCSKAIQNTKNLITHESYHYHTKCFRCAVCRRSLQGQNLYRVRNKLLCRDDYPNYGVENSQQANSRRLRPQVNHPLQSHQHQQHSYSHKPVTSTGRRVTSV